MDNYICDCSSCNGSNVVLKWQSQILRQQTIGTWDNIVIWEKGVLCTKCNVIHNLNGQGDNERFDATS